jgi:DNA-3-methyladenine glycosylase I
MNIGHCGWALANEMTRVYHDTEWGIPVRDDRQMFEHLTLECLQCGLSWGLMMKKREIFRACFDNFEYDRIAAYDESDIRRILNTEGMLRSEHKVRAVINNARCYQKLREEYGSFCDWLWSFSDGKTIIYDGHPDGKIPVSNGLSERISRELKKRGFKYIGAITIYSHLQACGIINDHARVCPCFDQINRMNSIVALPPDDEMGQMKVVH